MKDIYVRPKASVWPA